MQTTIKHSASALLMSLSILVLLAASLLSFSGCSSAISIKALVIPHFEIGELAGDDPGEAQFVYEKYLTNAQTFTLANEQTLYLDKKTGIALCLSGLGKTAMSSCLATVLGDSRFDFSETYLIIGGCGGGNTDYVTFGDVCLSTAAVDYDFGHSIDSSEAGPSGNTWFPDSGMAEASVKFANPQLMDRAYSIISTIKLDTNNSVREKLQIIMPENQIVKRDCSVVRGTSMTSDNYWKGLFEHNLAIRKTAYYECPDTYAVAEMEDVSALTVAEQYGMLDKTIVLRVVTNADVFLYGTTPEFLWQTQNSIADGPENSGLSSEVFSTAMSNLGKIEVALIEAILAGNL